MERSKELTELIDGVAKKMGGKTLTEAMQEKICVSCGKSVSGFRNPLSEKEYNISGLCQECQDKIFGKD